MIIFIDIVISGGFVFKNKKTERYYEKKIMFLLVLIILVIPSVTKATLEENLANELEVLEMNNIEIVETSVNEDGGKLLWN